MNNNMEQKYYYQSGMCTALHYNSLNPVLYQSEEEKVDYQKVRMACHAIETGVCTCPEQCQLLLDAPEQVAYNSFELLEKKIGE